MKALIETAYAKINLALHVRRRRDDGYHELETIFAFVDRGDVLTATIADGLHLSISGPFGGALDSGPDNLVMKTAALMRDHFNIDQGAALTLEKHLPVASGIGGGSADAAATARLLKRLWQLDVSETDLADLLTRLGADVPACVASVTVKGQGTGTDLEQISAPPVALHVLLVNPGLPLSTSAIFAAWDGVDNGPLLIGDVLDSAVAGRNDLQNPAILLCPVISDVLTSLAAQKPLLARMSGSGATCYAVFPSEADRDAAQDLVRAAHPEWWTFAGQLR
jgi:4-diphosphocytidyl-2-C-methyl-D-erythritol kinase